MSTKEQLFTDFGNYLQSERQLRPASVSAYIADASQFLEWTFTNSSVQSGNLLQEFEDNLRVKSIASRTRQRKVYIGRKFLEFSNLKQLSVADLKFVFYGKRPKRFRPDAPIKVGEQTNPIQRYLAYIAASKSQNTVRAYRKDLLTFWKATGNAIPREDILDKYCMMLAETSNKAASINRAVAVLRGYSHWLWKNGLVAKDPGVGVKQFRRKTSAPKTENLESPQPDFRCSSFVEREKLIFDLIFTYRLRPADVAALNCESFKHQAKLLHVSDDWQIPLGVESFNLLTEYLLRRSEITHTCNWSQDPLVINRNGGRITTRSIARILAQLNPTLNARKLHNLRAEKLHDVQPIHTNLAKIGLRGSSSAFRYGR